MFKYFYFSGDKTAELSASTGLMRDGSECVLLILILSVIYINIYSWQPKWAEKKSEKSHYWCFVFILLRLMIYDVLPNKGDIYKHHKIFLLYPLMFMCVSFLPPSPPIVCPIFFTHKGWQTFYIKVSMRQTIYIGGGYVHVDRE